MPWFITSIVNAAKAKDRNRRTFGFYNSYNEACAAVSDNRGNMEECLYDFLVVEYIEPGIHPLVLIEEWWKWNTQLHRWDKIEKGEVPKSFIGVTNWALG